ncbi:hypothetical protein INR49_004078 [Caranx melampygus]|nr:hypothetical protein INR49_004078 [Caranx melampygus]
MKLEAQLQQPDVRRSSRAGKTIERKCRTKDKRRQCLCLGKGDWTGTVSVNEHYFGLVNFGNTCYCNSVLQALYFCRPFREKVLAYKVSDERNAVAVTEGGLPLHRRVQRTRRSC